MFQKPNRKVTRVFIHCSANDNPIFAGRRLYNFIYDIHVNQNGWSDIGYHFLIDKHGQTMYGRPLRRTPAAQRGYNAKSIAIMVHGLEDFSEESMEALVDLCRDINEAYEGNIEFWEHREVNPHKTCPVFDAKAVLNLDEERHMIY